MNHLNGLLTKGEVSNGRGSLEAETVESGSEAPTGDKHGSRHNKEACNWNGLERVEASRLG
jgi:hypothetical protein